MLDAKGKFTPVVSVSVEPKRTHEMVWNVRVEGAATDTDSHYVLANGLVSGDLTLQERLQEATKNIMARR